MLKCMCLERYSSFKGNHPINSIVHLSRVDTSRVESNQVESSRTKPNRMILHTRCSRILLFGFEVETIFFQVQKWKDLL